MRYLYITVILLFSATVFSAEKPETFWQSSTPEEQGVDSEILLQMLQTIKNNNIRVRSIVFVRNNRLIMEGYWYPYNRDVLQDIKSVSKSFLSALTGIAVDEKKIPDISQTVEHYLPRYFSPGTESRKKKITLRHLLTMTTGLNIKENSTDTDKIFSENGDWVKTALTFPMSDDPGSAFNYMTPAYHIMAAVLTKAVNRPLLKYAEQNLFGPLEIKKMLWSRSPTGCYFGGAEMFFRPLDMAKFGALILQDGRWNNRQIISTGWIRESTANQIAGAKNHHGLKYGYGWYRRKGSILALGWGGQAIVINRSLNLVAVVTTSDKSAFRILDRFIVPSVTSDTSLPPNQNSVRTMRHMIAECVRPPAPETVPPLPGVAGEINGVTYNLEKNPLKIKKIRFDFREGLSVCRLTLETDSGSYFPDIGLDNIYRISPTGGFGLMPEDNMLALRGKWVGNEYFVLDYYEIGSVESPQIRFFFKKNSICLRATVMPGKFQYDIKGIQEP